MLLGVMKSHLWLVSLNILTSEVDDQDKMSPLETAIHNDISSSL